MGPRGDPGCAKMSWWRHATAATGAYGGAPRERCTEMANWLHATAAIGASGEAPHAARDRGNCDLRQSSAWVWELCDSCAKIIFSSGRVACQHLRAHIRGWQFSGTTLGDARAASWAEARVKIARVTLTIKLDGNWSSFQLANSAPPLSVTDSVIAGVRGSFARLQQVPQLSRPAKHTTADS